MIVPNMTLIVRYVFLVLLAVSLLATPGGALAQADRYAQLLKSPEHATRLHYAFSTQFPPPYLDSIIAHPITLLNQPATAPGPMFDSPTDAGLVFDAIAQHALFDPAPIQNLLDAPEGATIIVWFRADEPSRGTLVGSASPPAPSSSTHRSGFQILLGSSPYYPLANAFQLTFVVHSATGGFRAVAVTSVDWTNGDWHMLAATCKQGQLRLYYDGQPSRWATSQQGGFSRVGTLSNPVALAGLSTGLSNGQGTAQITDRKRSSIAQLSFHAAELSALQVESLWLAAHGSTGQPVYNEPAIRPWFRAALTSRVDAALIGDSNTLLGVDDAGAYGHQYGMSQGLRSVFPFYASPVMGGIGFNSWALRMSGMSNFITSTPLPPEYPEFIRQYIPDSGAGFSTRPFYADASTTIPITDAIRGSLSWESPDFLYDFRARTDWHLTYASFSSSTTGVMRPGLRLTQPPFTPLVEAAISSWSSSNGISRTVLPIPAGSREPGMGYSLQIHDIGDGLPAVGPFALLYHRFVLPDQAAGASMTPIWGVGGQSTRYLAHKLVNSTSLSQLATLMQELVRHQTPGANRLLIQILEGGNDQNDFAPAYNVDGSLSSHTSQSAAGQKLNTLATLTRLRSAWVFAGYDPAKLHFLLGPYHPAPTTGPRLRSVYIRGWRELARDHPELNITIMDAFGFTSIDEFYLNNWYNASGADVAHLSKAGFLNFGLQTWETLSTNVDFVHLPQGVCCQGATCRISPAHDCTGPFSRYEGTAQACNPAGSIAWPCCHADFNHDNTRSVQDLFDFLSAWFASEPHADVNASADINVQDIFDFLSRWFAGC